MMYILMSLLIFVTFLSPACGRETDGNCVRQFSSERGESGQFFRGFTNIPLPLFYEFSPPNTRFARPFGVVGIANAQMQAFVS
ncbi:hypothetical protein SC936_05240 [Aggregatibacter actinomycetemcomitans serotype e str. SC936]|nr:hypothetical protein SA3096_04285 [Aggregatibacter actinomycetemcomitans serotype e str. SA3096]KYK81085.1 hypothetical protein SC936_05240 [Aggregatibacter actinomycetemcomitans serotype e str. SC936]